jgi:hypothetical protein
MDVKLTATIRRELLIARFQQMAIDARIGEQSSMIASSYRIQSTVAGCRALTNEAHPHPSFQRRLEPRSLTDAKHLAPWPSARLMTWILAFARKTASALTQKRVIVNS